MRKKRVFRSRRKVTEERDGSHSSSSRPATEKARRPNMERRCRGTNSWWQPADRRCWRRAMSEVWMQQCVIYCGAVLPATRQMLAMSNVSEVWMQQSVMYCGTLCCRRRWTVAHSLYCTRWETSSQCSSSCRRWLSPWSYFHVSLTMWAAACSTRWCSSVLHLDAPARTELQKFMRDVTKACHTRDFTVCWNSPVFPDFQEERSS